MATRTILLAEPEPFQRQLVDMLLAEDDYQIVPCANGREALEYLREHTPALVLLALDLPDLGGDEVCEKIKSVTRLASVPVVLVAPQPATPGIPPHQRQHANAVGADLLLQKPLSDKNLRERLRQLVSRTSAAARAATVATKSTRVIEETLAILTGGGASGAELDQVTPSLVRENEALRFEVASLQRKIERLEAALREQVLVGRGAPRGDGAPERNAGDSSRAGTAPRSGAAVATGARSVAEAAGGGAPSRNGHAGADDDAAARIRDLERRNRALKQALVAEREKAGAKSGPRGLFGRRRDG